MFKIILADKKIIVDSLFESTKHFLHNYLADFDKSDFSVSISYDDIIFERKRSVSESANHYLNAYTYSDNYLETLALYRKTVSMMAQYNIILFHGSAVSVDGVGYIFTAKSGTGKSTHTKLWRELFGERAVMINDDKPLIEVSDEKVTIYGTPWDGKHHLGTNTSVPLKAICILERGDSNCIERISVEDAYPMLLQQTYKPSSSAELKKVLETFDRLMNGVRLYRLKCNMDVEAAQVAYEGMKED